MMPPALLAAIAFLTAAVPTIILVAKIGSPFLRTWLDLHTSAADAEKLKTALANAYAIVAKVADATPGFALDDGLATALGIVAKELEAVKGRPMTAAEKDKARIALLSMHANDAVDGHLGADGDGHLHAVMTHVAERVAPASA